MIESADRLAEAYGVPRWCQDEAGPYQAIPHPGAGWFPCGDPGRQPHEYVRGGTAKLLTLFRPATGEVRATGVTQAPNAVLHPWLQAELTAILHTLPDASPPVAAAPFIPDWWERRQQGAGGDHDPPLRLILIGDNLAGHKNVGMVRWLCTRGILPLDTPLSGSWLNMAESLQRIIVRRALAGQHPQAPEEIIGWLKETVAGWNAEPTPFVWEGKRWERRHRPQHRLLGGSAATVQSQLFAA